MKESWKNRESATNFERLYHDFWSRDPIPGYLFGKTGIMGHAGGSFVEKFPKLVRGDVFVSKMAKIIMVKSANFRTFSAIFDEVQTNSAFPDIDVVHMSGEL